MPVKDVRLDKLLSKMNRIEVLRVPNADDEFWDPSKVERGNVIALGSESPLERILIY